MIRSLWLVLLLPMSLVPFSTVAGTPSETMVEWVVSDGGGVEAGGHVSVRALPPVLIQGQTYAPDFRFVVEWFDWGSSIRPQSIEWFARVGCLEESPFGICLRNAQNITLGSSTVEGSYALGETFSVAASWSLSQQSFVNGTLATLGFRMAALVECLDSSICAPVGGVNPAQRFAFLRPESSTSFILVGPGQEFFAEAILATRNAAVGSPASFNISFEKRFSRIDQVRFHFSFEHDLFDPGEVITVYSDEFLPFTTGGFGSINIGNYSREDQTMTLVRESHPFVDSLSDGTLAGSVVMEAGSVTVRSLVMVVVGDPVLPVVGVWSNTCRSSNITISNPACGTLQVDSAITVQVNVTNMPDFSAFDLFLYYDSDYLRAESVDEATGTVFNQPFLLAKELEPPGKIRVAVVNVGGAYTGRNGTLFHLNFKIKGVGVSPLTLAAGIATSTNFAKEYTRIVTGGTPGTYLEVDTSDGYFKNEPVKRGPVAGFTFTPSNPQRDDVVTFDASNSFDADNDVGPGRGIAEYRWDFGEGNGLTTDSSLATHVFGPTAVGAERYYGNFSVRLTVVDNENFKGMITRRVWVEQEPFHDVEVQSITASPVRAEPGDKVQITVEIFNKGTFSETYNLTVRSLGPPERVLGTEQARFLGSRQKETFRYVFDTVGLSPGLYIVRASVTVGIDEDSTNNVKDTVVNVAQTSNLQPMASFTFRPASPVVGDLVFFDGSASADPDGTVQSWFWDFGDGSIGLDSFTLHSYLSPGDYVVTLTVRDNRGGTGTRSDVVHVRSRPTHDVAIDQITVFPTEAVSSQLVSITVVLRNRGVAEETVDLAVYFDSQIIEMRTGVVLRAASFNEYISIVWDTLGVDPGSYKISATAFLGTDEFPDDNHLVDGHVMILPPPRIDLTPGSGSLGDRIVVRGSGFPLPVYGFTQVFVTLDDMFLGLTIVSDGEFEFVFNLPHAEPGLHQVKAFDSFSGARALADFLVLSSDSSVPSDLVVEVEPGTLYFPGDSVEIRVLVTSKGNPADMVAPGTSLRLEIILYKPDGSPVTLNAAYMGPGLYKASYTIPRTGSLGTYAILVRAELIVCIEPCLTDELFIVDAAGSDLASFQVKPSWISVQGPRIVSASAVVLGVAVLAVAWRKGLFRREEGDSALP